MIIPVRKELFDYCNDVRTIERRLEWCANYIFMSSAVRVTDMELFEQIIGKEFVSVDLDDGLLSEIQLKTGVISDDKLIKLVNVILLSSYVYGEPE